jgi:MFS family permease
VISYQRMGPGVNRVENVRVSRFGQRRAVAAALAIVTAAQLPAFLTGALAVQVRGDLRFSATGLGIAMAAFFVASASGSAVLGHLVERIGWRAGMLLGVAGSAVSLLGVAAVAGTWGALVALLVVGGFGNAIAQPAANLALTRAIDRERQGLVFGIKQSAIPVATLIGGLSVPLFAVTVGWRWTYAAGVGLALLAALTVPPQPGVARRSRAAPQRRADADAIREPARRSALVPLIVLAAAGGLGAMVGNVLGAFLVSSAAASGLRPAFAGLLLAVGSVASIGIRTGAGWAADLWSFDPLRAVAGLLAAGGGGCLLLVADSPAPLVAATVLAFGAGWAWPGLFNLAVVRAYPAAPAAATGITQTGVYVGAALGPVVAGVIIDGAGYDAGWIVTAVLALAAAALAMVGARSLARLRFAERAAT